MSAMSQLHEEVTCLLEEGFSPRSVAVMCNQPLEAVLAIAEEMGAEVYNPFETVNS